MGMAAITRQVREWFWHERCPQSMLFSNRFDHVFKKDMSVRGHERIGIIPVHFKLPIRIFMIVLVRAPAQLDHRVTDFTNDIKAPH